MNISNEEILEKNFKKCQNKYNFFSNLKKNKSNLYSITEQKK